MTPLQFTRSVRSLNRLRLIAQVLTRHGFGHIVAQINLTRFVPVWMLRKKAAPPSAEEGASAIGRRLAQVCAELGPTFVKLGQLMSTRPDLLPPEMLRELRKLQDKVPPFDTEEALEIIAKELGRPVDECFESFDRTPIGSASISQVYRATIANEGDVVVKVRRPDIEDIIRLDMQLLKWLAESLENLIPELRIFRPTMLVAELEEILTRELDFINEASTTTRFVEAFADDPWIHVPRVYWELSGPRILVLEALPGTNVESLLDADSSSTPIDRRLIARRLADCYLKQIFELGMFHADPHPGNILVEPPATVGIIDFGQVGTIGDELMTEIVTIVYGCVNNEMDLVIDTLADMGALGPETDRDNLNRAMRVLINKYYGLPLKRLDLATLFAEFSEVIRRNDVVIQRDLSTLAKALGTISGVATRLDPELDLLELVKPRLREVLRDRFSPTHIARRTTLMGWDIFSILRRAPRQLRAALRKISSGTWELHVRHENIDRLISELDRSSNRLAFSIVIAAIIVGSSVVVGAAAELKVFGFPVQYIGIIGYLIAGVLGLGLSWAIFRSGRLH